MYDYSRVFLPKDHPYRRVTYDFNGKPERTKILETMVPSDWIRANETNKLKEFS